MLKDIIEKTRKENPGNLETKVGGAGSAARPQVWNCPKNGREHLLTRRPRNCVIALRRGYIQGKRDRRNARRKRLRSSLEKNLNIR